MKLSNPGKGVAPSPTPWCSSFWKVSLRVTLDYSRQLYLLFTRQIHIQIQSKTNTGELLFLVRMHLSTSDFGSSTRGERHNSNYADHTIWPYKCAVHLVVFKISVGRDPKNPTTSSVVKIQLSTQWQSTQLSASMVQCQLPNRLFFKNLKFSEPSIPGITSSTLHPHFLSGVYYERSSTLPYTLVWFGLFGFMAYQPL